MVDKKFVKEIRPMFRDADAQGMIGMRAYLYYFQDVATEYLYHMGKGNDSLPEKYGAAWFYTKYKMKVYQQADFSKMLHIETWIEKMDKLRIWQDMEISVGDEVYAVGRLESCIYHLNEQKIGKLSDIEMPEETVLDQHVELDNFSKIRHDISDMNNSYSHIVRYSDIDKSQHMANLRYMNLMENIFPPEVYQQHMLREMELHYVAQSFYGDEIKIYEKQQDTGYLTAGEKQDGTIVFVGNLVF